MIHCKQTPGHYSISSVALPVNYLVGVLLFELPGGLHPLLPIEDSIADCKPIACCKHVVINQEGKYRKPKRKDVELSINQ